jgi:hypothetical protein
MKLRHLYTILLVTGFLHITILYIFGQPFFSATGNIYLYWFGGGVEDSQQFFDWYTFSHFIHGIVFYILLGYIYDFLIKKLAFQKYFEESNKDPSSHELKKVGVVFVFAFILESSWEILENSPVIINRYREGALAAGYFGDSIFNSMSDVFFMCVGFYFASRLGWKTSLAIVIFLELFTLYFIRDNLTLNILMLLYPSPDISSWQIGA